MSVIAATSVSVTGDWESPSNGIYQTNVLDRNRFAAELCRPQRRSLPAHQAAQSLEVNRSMSVAAWKRRPRELIMASMVVSLHVARCAHHFGTCLLQLIGWRCFILCLSWLSLVSCVAPTTTGSTSVPSPGLGDRSLKSPITFVRLSYDFSCVGTRSRQGLGRCQSSRRVSRKCTNAGFVGLGSSTS